MHRRTLRLPPWLIGIAALPLLGGSFPDGCHDMSCEERVAAANDYVSSVVAENLDCRTDSDCTTVGIGTDCMGMCPVPVSVDGVDEVLAAVAYANATWCENYIEDGCPYATPSCAAFDPVCENGQCVAAFY